MPKDFPAFPRAGTPYGFSDPGVEGMTLRQYYAGQALVGIINSANFKSLSLSGYEWEDLYPEVAKHACAFADALIAELEKKP